ncbi:MAG TPA: hypothetical protein DCQ98_01435 [Planctomycetaceae bacterium]|nr:hypothetical protein [Planctomycetaceae bacterium]
MDREHQTDSVAGARRAVRGAGLVSKGRSDRVGVRSLGDGAMRLNHSLDPDRPASVGPNERRP